MLHDRDRIFTNLYGEHSWGLEAARQRGDWDGTKDFILKGREWLVQQVTDSGLRGRGGAGFCAGQKWSFIPKEKKGPHYLAVNADESEPGTFKDRYLIDYDPHGMLEGIAIAAIATQCDIAYIFIRGEYHRQAKVLEARSRKRTTTRSSGSRGSSAASTSSSATSTAAPARTSAAKRPDCSKRSKASAAGRATSRRSRRSPARSPRPTVINNVETLCCVPLIIEKGPDWFKSMGTKTSPGPKLYGMSGHVNKPGVYEDELGITLDYAIDKLAGGMKGGKHKGAICGGISMGVLGPDQLDIKLDFDDVRFRGGCLGLGTAGMIVMNEHTDMVKALRNCVRFYAHESCGQCTPCREGSAWMRKILNRSWTDGRRPADVDLLLDVHQGDRGSHDLRPGRRGGVAGPGADPPLRPEIKRRIMTYTQETRRAA